MKSIKDYSVEYATVKCFSASNKWCVLLHNFQSFDLFDSNLNLNMKLKISASQEPRWDGELLYFIVGNSLFVYDFSNTYERNSPDLVYYFSEYIQFDSSERNGVQGLGEGDIENHKIALAGMLPDGTRDIFLFDLSNLTKGGVLNLRRDDSLELRFMKNGRAHGLDNIYATSDSNGNDKVLVSWVASGLDRYNGVELFDKNMNFIRQLTSTMGHMDVGPSGLVWCSSNDPKIDGNYVYLVDKNKILFDAEWNYAFHVSCCDEDFCIVSLDDPSGGLPHQLWQIYSDTHAVLMDMYTGSNRSGTYESQQKASISKDGSRIARCRLDNNGDYFTDVFGLGSEPDSRSTYPGFKEIKIKKRNLIELNEDGTFREFEEK